jgi:hypothetical protein
VVAGGPSWSDPRLKKLRPGTVSTLFGVDKYFEYIEIEKLLRNLFLTGFKGRSNAFCGFFNIFLHF